MSFRRLIEGIFNNDELSDIKTKLKIKIMNRDGQTKIFNYIFEQLSDIKNKSKRICNKNTKAEIDTIRLRLFVTKRMIQTFQTEIKIDIFDKDIAILDVYIQKMEIAERDWCKNN